MTPEIKSSNALTGLSAIPLIGPGFTAWNQSRMQKQVRKLKADDFIPQSFREMKAASKGLSNDATIAGESAAMEMLDRDTSEMMGNAMASGMDASTLQSLLKNQQNKTARGRQKLKMAGAQERERRLGNYMNVLGKEAGLQDSARKEISGMYSALEGAKQANMAKMGENITEAGLLVLTGGKSGMLKGKAGMLKGAKGSGAGSSGGIRSYESNYGKMDIQSILGQ